MNIYFVKYQDANFVKLNPSYKIGWCVSILTKVNVNYFVQEELIISPDGIKTYGNFSPSSDAIFKGERRVVMSIFEKET